MKHCFCCAQSAKSKNVLIFCEKLALSPLTHWDWHRDNWFVLEFIIRSFLPRCPNTLKPGVRGGRLNSLDSVSTRSKWKELNDGEEKDRLRGGGKEERGCNNLSMLIDLPLMRFYRKSRRMKPAGGKVAAWERKKKKEEDQEWECSSGSLICSVVDPQCAADLAGPLIACRCNNMDWSSAGVGGSAAHREDIPTALSSGKQPLSCGLQDV